jgi:hypothetical protein
MYLISIPNRFIGLYVVACFEFKRVRGVVFVNLQVDGLDGLGGLLRILAPIQVEEWSDQCSCQEVRPTSLQKRI